MILKSCKYNFEILKMIPDQLHYTSINIIQYSELSQAACYFVLDLIGYGNFLLN